MRYAAIKQLSCEQFRRLTGVKPKTFGAMIGILRLSEEQKHAQGGRPPILSLEDRLLMTLEYWREYRTYFHISQSYGVSEGTCWQTVRWMENTLIQSKMFSLPGKKALLKSDTAFEVILVDATETPCQRPQKNRSASIRGRRNATR